MAKNYEEFRKDGKQMVDYICDYVNTMDQRPVAPTIDPGYLVPLLAGKNHAIIGHHVESLKLKKSSFKLDQMRCREKQKPSPT